MIRHLAMQNVGPAHSLTFDFAPRLNVLTGDNGLGKSFVLDVIWFVVTGTWAGTPAFPWTPPPGLTSEGDTEIFARIATYDPMHDARVRTRWSREMNAWGRVSGARVTGGDPENGSANEHPPGLVIYSRLDGRYAVYDGTLQWPRPDGAGPDVTLLSAADLWDGREDPNPAGPGRRRVIGGLVADWVSWQQRSGSEEWMALQAVLERLRPPDEPTFRPGEPTRVDLNDRRDIPTLVLDHGVVPVTLASAGFRRALSLAYLLVWSWSEHKRATVRRGLPLARTMTVLLDEPELHLHPSWQRTFLPAVLEAVRAVAPEVEVQVITATHSPLVLASVEVLFEEGRDDLFVLERVGRSVQASDLTFEKHGDVGNWLASQAFGGVSGRSPEAELATEAAMHFMAGRMGDAETRVAELEASLPAPRGHVMTASLIDRVHRGLLATLAGGDPFWSRWSLTWERAPRSAAP